MYRLAFKFTIYRYRYCPKCKNDASEIVKAGEKLKESKKKAKMASQQGNNSRDWGRVRIQIKNIV